VSNQSLSFNSTDLGGSSYGAILERHARPVAPRVIETTVIPGADGAITYGGYLGAQGVDLPLVVEGTSRSDLHDKLDAIALALHTDEAKSLAPDYLGGRYWLAQLASLGPIEYFGMTAARIMARFNVADARLYAASETSQTLTVATDPDSFSVPASGDVAGTAVADPEWELTLSAGASSIEIENTTRGESLTYGASLTSGDKLKIVSAPTSMRVYVDVGSGYAESMGDVSGVPPRLTPGVSNSVTVTGLSSGSLDVTYRARYLL
jgi:hypothetical protein